MNERKETLKFESGHFEAVVTVCKGFRKLSRFLRACDLGMTGVGTNERVRIVYKRGEYVDEARVCRAMDASIEAMESEGTPFEVLGYTVERVVFVPEEVEEETAGCDDELTTMQ